MNVKSVLGKRIVKVSQARFYNSHLALFSHVVHYIELEDGTRLVPEPYETEEGPSANVMVFGPKKGSKS